MAPRKDDDNARGAAEQAGGGAGKTEPASSTKSSGTAYLNTTTSPVVYDKDGHVVGGGEWTPDITLDAVGKRARQAGHLTPRSAL